MRPLIGILLRYDENENGTSLEYIFDSLRRAVIKMGGEPLLLSPVQDIDYYHTKKDEYKDLTTEEKIRLYYFLDMCDGLVIPGGNKISPYDFFVLEKALERKLPILGICLGMQIIANYKVDHFSLDDVEEKEVHNKPIEEKYAHDISNYWKENNSS